VAVEQPFTLVQAINPPDSGSEPCLARAHELGMAILWCYLRNNTFKQDKDYHLAADLTGRQIT